MSEPTDQAVAPGAGGTSPAAAPTAGQPVDWQKQAEDSQKRFAGLQAKYQQEQAKWQADAAKLLDFEGQLKQITGEKEAAILLHQSVQEKLDAASTDVEVTKANLERLKILTKPDYIELLPFEQQGILPDGNGEDLEAKLKSFLAVLQARGQAVVKQLQGAAPPPPPAPAQQADAKGLRAQAIEALKNGDTAKYQDLIDQAIKAMSTQKK